MSAPINFTAFSSKTGKEPTAEQIATSRCLTLLFATMRLREVLAREMQSPSQPDLSTAIAEFCLTLMMHGGELQADLSTLARKLGFTMIAIPERDKGGIN